MLTNTASAPLRRASVNPTRSRTMSVKSNTQLSRAGGVMEARLLWGSSVLLEPMPRRKEGEAGWYTFGSGEIHLRLPGSGLWAAFGRDGGFPHWLTMQRRNDTLEGLQGFRFGPQPPAGWDVDALLLYSSRWIRCLYCTWRLFYFRDLHLYTNICNLQFLHLKKHAHCFTHITLLR